MEFQMGRTTRAGASMVREGKLPVDEALLPRICSFDAERHARGEESLCSRSAEIYMGYPASKRLCESFDAGSFHIVFEEDGEAAGFIRGYEFGEDVSEFEAPLTLCEVEYMPEKPYVLQSLIAYALNHALDKGIDRVTARMPFDQRIIDVLAQMPLRFQLIETYGGASSNMLQIISLKSLFGKLIPELESRLKASALCNFHCSLEIGIGKAQVLIKSAGGKLTVPETGNSGTRLVLSEGHMLNLVLGLSSVAEIKHIISGIEKLSPAELDFLNILFPRKLVFSGNWG